VSRQDFRPSSLLEANSNLKTSWEVRVLYSSKR
jgi:hypothetical protein